MSAVPAGYASTVRHGLAILGLAEGWIELERAPLWRVTHHERNCVLELSLFALAAGVTIDLAALRVLAEKRRRTGEENRGPFGCGGFDDDRRILLNEDSWALGAVFCVETSLRVESHPGPTFSRSWTVSDGVRVLEGTFEAENEELFGRGVEDCDHMMRSVRLMCAR